LNKEERPFEEIALLAPPRGTELADLVEEFWESQKRRIAYQLKIISRGKYWLKRMVKNKKVLQMILEFEEALRKKEGFEKAFKEAMEKLSCFQGKEEAVPYFTLVEMIKEKKPFEKVIDYIKPLLKKEGRWSDWAELWYYRYKDQEERIKKRIKSVVEDWPVWQNWLKYLNGIDLLLAAQLKGGFESAISPEETIGTHFKNPSQMRQYSGLGDPKKSKRVKREPLHCNLKLKSVLEGRIAASFLRQVDRETGKSKSGYRELYLKFKEEIIKKNKAKGIKIVPASQLPEREDGKKYEPSGVISEGHIHQQALRKMMQIFVNHLWEICRKAEGLPAGPKESYAFKVLKHPLSSYIPPIRDIPEHSGKEN
jgi:adenylate kinase family enzyme